MKLILFIAILLAALVLYVCIIKKDFINKHYKRIFGAISLIFYAFFFFIIFADNNPLLKSINTISFFLYTFSQAFSILFIVKMQNNDNLEPYVRIMSFLCLLCIFYLIFFSNNIYISLRS